MSYYVGSCSKSNECWNLKAAVKEAPDYWVHDGSETIFPGYSSRGSLLSASDLYCIPLHGLKHPARHTECYMITYKYQMVNTDTRFELFDNDSGYRQPFKTTRRVEGSRRFSIAVPIPPATERPNCA